MKLVRVGTQYDSISLFFSLVGEPGFDDILGEHVTAEQKRVVSFERIERLLQRAGRGLPSPALRSHIPIYTFCLFPGHSPRLGVRLADRFFGLVTDASVDGCFGFVATILANGSFVFFASLLICCSLAVSFIRIKWILHKFVFVELYQKATATMKNGQSFSISLP
jgi:hypothetical protein